MSLTSRSTWGGARAGAGRPQQRIRLDLEHAAYLRRLVELYNRENEERGAWQGYEPQPKSADSYIQDLIFHEAMMKLSLEGMLTILSEDTPELLDKNKKADASQEVTE